MTTRNVPWWGIASSGAAGVLMAAGWTIGASLQSRPYDPTADTVSALAGIGATDRWVMTLAFALVSACDIVTGLALRQARMAGRLILMAGGIAGILVAAYRCTWETVHRDRTSCGRRQGSPHWRHGRWPLPVAVRGAHLLSAGLGPVSSAPGQDVEGDRYLDGAVRERPREELLGPGEAAQDGVPVHCQATSRFAINQLRDNSFGNPRWSGVGRFLESIIRCVEARNAEPACTACRGRGWKFSQAARKSAVPRVFAPRRRLAQRPAGPVDLVDEPAAVLRRSVLRRSVLRRSAISSRSRPATPRCRRARARAQGRPSQHLRPADHGREGSRLTSSNRSQPLVWRNELWFSFNIDVKAGYRMVSNERWRSPRVQPVRLLEEFI
jgi:Protein of unknown function (DUF998)